MTVIITIAVGNEVENVTLYSQVYTLTFGRRYLRLTVEGAVKLVERNVFDGEERDEMSAKEREKMCEEGE